MNVELALKISRYIHDNCENVPHDIGLKIMEIIKNNDDFKAMEQHDIDYEPVLMFPKLKGKKE